MAYYSAKRAELRRIRLIRRKYVPKGDPLAKPVVAPLPPSLQDRCIATPGLIAEIIDNRSTCHLPYYRQAEILAREGVRFDRKTLCDWVAPPRLSRRRSVRCLRRRHAHVCMLPVPELIEAACGALACYLLPAQIEKTFKVVALGPSCSVAHSNYWRWTKQGCTNWDSGTARILILLSGISFRLLGIIPNLNIFFEAELVIHDIFHIIDKITRYNTNQRTS
jgi:Transposase IS66 family